MAGEAFDPDAFLAEEPEAFDPDSFLAEPAAAPVDPLMGSDGIELAPLPRDPRRLSNPYAGQQAQYEEEQRHREALVREAFEFTKDPGLTPVQVDLKVAQHFGIPEDVVARNRDQWLKDYARASGDPKAWIRDNPLAAKLVLDHPERANHIVNNKEMNGLLQGLNKVLDFVEDNAETLQSVARPTAQVLAGALLMPAGSLLSDQPGVDKGPTPAQLAARAQRDAPKQVTEVDDAEAARIREAGTPAILAQRAKEAQAELEISKKYHALSWARTTGKPTLDLERDIYQMEQAATPKYLGETGWRQALSEVVGTSMSTVGVMENVGKGAAIGTAAGLAIGGAARNPAAGARLGMKWGGRYGAAEGSFIYENGSSYRELLKVKTEAGQSLTDAEARGGAAIAALLKTGIELAELSVLLKAMGPAGELLRGGGMKAVKQALMTNPGFRAAAANAAKSLVANGIEEVAQDSVDQGAIYLMKSHRAGALEKGPVFDVERLKENFVGGLMGGTLFGAGGLAFTSAQYAIAQSKEQRNALAVPELVKLAGDPTVQSMPDAVAKLIADKTAETGDDQTHVYMDPAAFIRYFQNDETKANQKAVELLGPTGPQQMAAAAVFGGNAEIPNAAFLRSAGKDFAAGMVDDLALQQGQATPRQLKQKAEANEKWAEELAKGIAPSETLSRFDVLEDQLVATGTHTPSEAKAAMTPLRDALINLAKRFGKTTEDLFRDVRIRIDDGTALLELLRKQANASERLSRELLDGLPNEEKARRLYIDPVSGLRNRRGFDETLRTPGRQVAVVTSPDIKALNDDAEGGHDTANDLLRVIGAAVGEVDPNAARSGTNFLLEVDSPEHLEQVLARLRTALPDAALTLEGATAASLDDAFVALDAKVEALRSEATPADKRLGARGTTRYDLSKLKGQKFSPGKAKENLAGEFVTKAGTLLPEEFFREAYQDKQVPGVLSATAWNQLPRKAHVASIDIKGLKDINALGKEVGDKILKLFAQVAERNDGSDFDFSHLSGDEYAAQSDDPVKLQAWLDHVKAELQKNPLRIDNEKTGEVLEIEAKFRSGIGEKTYGAADRALNRAKREEARLRDEGKAAADQPGGSRADGEGGRGSVQAAPGLRADAAQPKYERTRAPRQGFIGPRKEVTDDTDRLNQDKDEKNLLVQHNLKPEALLHADKMGGLAAPSIAISRKEHPLEGFGDITLLTSKDVVDPEKGTPVYDADIYTPRYPDTGFDIDKKKDLELDAWMKPFAKRTGAYLSDFTNQLREKGVEAALTPNMMGVFGLAWLESRGVKLPAEEGRPLAYFVRDTIEDGPDRAAYERFVRAKVEPVISGTHILHRTKTGNLRKIPHTIENVLKAITRRLQGGEGFNYGLGNVRAAGATKFRSIKQVQKARDKITSKQEFNELKERNDERWGKLTDQFAKHDAQSNPWSRSAERLGDALAASYKQGADLQAALASRGFKDVPSGLVEELAQFAVDLVDMPTEYFEAKPQRVVQLSEFRAAVVPHDVSPQVLAVLKKHGVATYFYDENGADASDVGGVGKVSGTRRGAVDKATTDLDLLFATTGSGAPKGWTQLAREGIDRVFRVALVQKADKSTFLHESAHVFLELFADLAERADAPKSVLDDWQTTLKWLGVEGREGIKREHHEKWAKAWEFYLAKGEYPADRLAGAFQRFRLWMMAVYKHLSEVGGEINEDIKGVFDRLLATDAEIDASKARMGLKALPREALGLDAVAYAEYLDEMQRATSTAAQLADHQVAKDQLRATEDWWKSALAEEKKKAAEAYENLPARRAQLLLQGKPAGDFLGIKEPLNKADVVAMVGEQHAKKFKTSKDGVRPDDIVAMAEGLLGYATGKEMLEAVLKVPEKDVWVDLVADNAVREQFPGVIEERTRLRDLVAQGLHGTATKAWVLKEFKALNARVSQKPGEMPPAEVLKRAAEIAAGGRPAGRLQARDAQVAERQAANNAAEAAAKGNFAQAAVFKRQQLLNMYLFDALTKAKKEVEAFEEKGRQLSKTAARQRLGKADPKYRDAVDTILGTFDVAEPEPGLTKSLDAVLQEVEKLMAEDQTPVAFDRGLLVDRASTRGLRGWRELPLEDVRHIMRALQNIEAAARNRSTVLIDDKRADLAEVVEGLSKEAGLLDARPPDPTPEAATAGQWFGKQWTALDGALLKPETLSRFLSGTADTTEFLKSWWFRAIVAPMQKAKVRELDLGREVLKPLVEAFERIPNSGRQMEKVDSAKLFPDHVSVEKPQRRFEILMMLLHTGNQSNLDRLTKGRGITEEQVRQAAVHVGITKEEYDWVQMVWDTAEKLKPLAFDLEEKHTGVRPEAITPRPFQTPFGEYAGGYFPAVYSPASGVGARQEAQLAQLKDPNVNRPSTTHNYLKSRVEDFSDIISLSPSSITRHFALVLHDVAFREAVQSVGGILSNQAVRDVMRERVGDGRAKQLLQWVGDVAQMRGLEGFDKSGGLARLAMWMRGNFVTSVLGYKVPNALEDFTTNLTSSFNASDLKPQHLAAGLAEFYATGKNSYQMALGKSGELRARRKQVQRELAKGVKDLTASGVGKLLSTGPIGWYKEHAFAFQEFTEYATATPIWIGAYRQALGEEKSEADAVAFADAIVRQVVVSHNPVDLSALMRDKGPIGYLTMFFGAFNHFYNQFRTLGHDFAEADTLKTRAAKAGKMMGLATGIFLVGSLVRGKGPDKDEEEWEWALRKVFLDGLMQMVPLVNVAGKVGDRALTKKQLPARDNSLFGLTERMGESMLKLAKDDTTDAARMKAFLDLVGPLAGLPTAGPTQVYDALMNWALGPEQAN